MSEKDDPELFQVFGSELRKNPVVDLIIRKDLCIATTPTGRANPRPPFPWVLAERGGGYRLHPTLSNLRLAVFETTAHGHGGIMACVSAEGILREAHRYIGVLPHT